LSNKYLVVILGPTAVGKTDACIQLAQHFHTEIISADSRQFYQGMAIGTAQPTAMQKQAIPHHFVDFLPIQASYSAGLFAKDAMATIQQLFQTHTHVILTGGSGLYLKAVYQGLAELPPIEARIRKQLISELQQVGLAQLQQELAIRDPEYYARVDLSNPQRVLRALEVCRATGQPYSNFHRQPEAPRPFKIIKIGLCRHREELYQRIDQRVQNMLEQGLLEEAITLYPYQNCNALQTVGYKELFQYLAGHSPLQDAISLIKRNTRRYAKRQMTWFRSDSTIYWSHPSQLANIIAYINQKTMPETH
jgi:tRNA dimethylallyltransferase